MFNWVFLALSFALYVFGYKIDAIYYLIISVFFAIEYYYLQKRTINLKIMYRVDEEFFHYLSSTMFNDKTDEEIINIIRGANEKIMITFIEE